jgi:hypothetical protein
MSIAEFQWPRKEGIFMLFKKPTPGQNRLFSLACFGLGHQAASSLARDRIRTRCSLPQKTDEAQELTTIQLHDRLIIS